MCTHLLNGTEGSWHAGSASAGRMVLVFFLRKVSLLEINSCGVVWFGCEVLSLLLGSSTSACFCGFGLDYCFLFFF